MAWSVSLFWEAVLCTVGYLAGLRWLGPGSMWDNQKCLPTLSKVPWGQSHVQWSLSATDEGVGVPGCTRDKPPTHLERAWLPKWKQNHSRVSEGHRAQRAQIQMMCGASSRKKRLQISRVDTNYFYSVVRYVQTWNQACIPQACNFYNYKIKTASRLWQPNSKPINLKLTAFL